MSVLLGVSPHAHVCSAGSEMSVLLGAWQDTQQNRCLFCWVSCHTPMSVLLGVSVWRVVLGGENILRTRHPAEHVSLSVSVWRVVLGGVLFPPAELCGETPSRTDMGVATHPAEQTWVGGECTVCSCHRYEYDFTYTHR